MNINETFELPNGSVKFEGVIDGDELKAVINAGLNVMLYHGMLPLVKKGPDTPMTEEIFNNPYEQ